MFEILIILQVGTEALSSHVSASEATNVINSNTWIIIAVIAVLNILLCFIQWLINTHVKNMDVKIFRKNEINKISIEVGKELYLKLIMLSNQLNDDDTEKINLVISVSKYKDANKIYLSSKLLKISDEMIDYFTKIIVYHSEKDFDYENCQLKKFKDEFYG